MKTKDKEVNDFLESIGWMHYEATDQKIRIQYLDIGDTLYGDSWYHLNNEVGFNTGTDYFLAVRNNVKMGETVRIHIASQEYSSYSNHGNVQKYSLEDMNDMKTLTRFLRD